MGTKTQGISLKRWSRFDGHLHGSSVSSGNFLKGEVIIGKEKKWQFHKPAIEVLPIGRLAQET